MQAKVSRPVCKSKFAIRRLTGVNKEILRRFALGRRMVTKKGESRATIDDSIRT
jgi:hypothetical protein